MVPPMTSVMKSIAFIIGEGIRELEFVGGFGQQRQCGEDAES